MSTPPHNYDVHGLTIHVVTNHDVLAAAIAAILAPFVSEATALPACTLSMRFAVGHDFIPADPQMRLFWSGRLPDGQEMAYYCATDQRLVELPGVSQMRMDLAAGRADLLVAGKVDANAIEDGCVVPLLYEFLGATGQHLLHAACLAIGPADGAVAVLIAGPSGIGKTTTALALGRGGMTMLTDDATFICDDGDSPAAWALTLPCKVLPQTYRLLPWLADLPSRPGRQGPERAIDLAPPGPVDRLVRPTAIIFLDGPNGDGHAIAPLDKVAALKRLLSENVRAYEPDGDGGAGKAFRSFARLVGHCRTYRLSVGPDLASLPELVVDSLGLENA